MRKITDIAALFLFESLDFSNKKRTSNSEPENKKINSILGIDPKGEDVRADPMAIITLKKITNKTTEILNINFPSEDTRGENSKDMYEEVYPSHSANSLFQPQNSKDSLLILSCNGVTTHVKVIKYVDHLNVAALYKLLLNQNSFVTSLLLLTKSSKF